VDEMAQVMIELYDVTGKIIWKKNIGTMKEGTYSELITNGTFTNGIYFLKYSCGDKVLTRKLSLSK
jgi:hypothetical protein